MRFILFLAGICLSLLGQGQTPTPFTCSGTDGFGYYIASASNNGTSGTPVFSSSRLSKLTTASGARTTLCSAVQIGVSLNALAFNPADNYLYAFSRFDASQFSGVLFRLGENCEKIDIPVIGPLVTYNTNNATTVDAGGGNISSGTFDLEGNYYVNTSFALTASTGFRNKIQKISISGSSANVVSTKTLTCTSCTGELQITDIIYDETTKSLYGNNRINNRLYKINAATGVITPVATGTTGINQSILGIYKNRYGAVRAIAANGNIYAVNLSTGKFTFLASATDLNSSNADAASGCYAAPTIQGRVYIDADGLTNDTINGTGTNVAGTTPLYANLIQSNTVVATTALRVDGNYEFAGDFVGTYEVRISITQGTVGGSPPSLGLPSTHIFVGDYIGTGPGNDGTPNGRLTFTLTSGNSISNVNFGINTQPVVQNLDVPLQPNPGGTTRVPVPNLPRTDAEDGQPTTLFFILPPASQGLLYYNGTPVKENVDLLNFDDALLEFDPADGEVSVAFNFAVRDRAGATSNQATVTMAFSADLPITLDYFTGAYHRGKTTLRWQTSSELNTDYFAVERSTTGLAFTEIGRIEARGGSTGWRDYRFVDSHPGPSAYYRLKDVDFDGASSHSNTIYLVQAYQQKVTIYPTLVKEKLTVEHDGGSASQLTLSFYNSTGSKLLTARLAAGEREVNVTLLPQGLYTVVITNGQDGAVTTHQLVKQ